MTIKFNHESYRFTFKESDQTDYLEKIAKYKNECGCALGAIFMTLALVIFSVYALQTVDWNHPDLINIVLSGLVSVLLAAALGKVIGIGIARIRLKLLYRFLVAEKYLELIETR